jgi:hypothetical protein
MVGWRVVRVGAMMMGNRRIERKRQRERESWEKRVDNCYSCMAGIIWEYHSQRCTCLVFSGRRTRSHGSEVNLDTRGAELSRVFLFSLFFLLFLVLIESTPRCFGNPIHKLPPDKRHCRFSLSLSLSLKSPRG